MAAQATDRLDLPRENILAFTMPGFATSALTRANALALMAALRVTGRELDIRPTAKRCCRNWGILSPRENRSTT